MAIRQALGRAASIVSHRVPGGAPSGTIALAALIVLIGLTGFVASASGPGRPDPAAQLKAQREAMERLAFMDGVWRGPAWTILPSGERHDIVQTERIGPFLDGAVKVIEGRGYDAEGSVGFNALGIVSFDGEAGKYTLRSYAQGRVGDFTLTPSDSGYVWEIPAGAMTIRYTANIGKTAWREVGDRFGPGQDPVRFFEMNLIRISDTDWPAGGTISPK